MNKYIRLISLILVVMTLFSTVVGCASTDNSNATNQGSDLQGDESEFQQIDGILTLFAADEYRAKVIRAEMPSDFDKNVYNDIKDLFKKRTGKNPPISTDFVAAGEERYDGPAVLIGETDYPESKAAYRKLGEGEASATFTGNKYVIAFTTQDSVDSLLASLKSNLNKKATKTEVNIDAAWNITVKLQYHTSGNETFDDTGLKSSASLPSGLGDKHDAGQGCYTYIKKNADKAAFESLCSAAESNGFKKYTTNTIGNNLYATYVTQSQIVNFMFFPNKSEIRTSVDKRGTGTSGFTLPGLSGDNKYVSTKNSLMSLVQIENASWPGGMCLIFKLCDGRFVIIDSGVGGRNNDGSSSGWVYATLAKHADDPKNIQVAAWIITHVHSDHAGGLYDMANGWYETSYPIDNEQTKRHNVMPRECKEWIKIDTIIYNQPAVMVDGRSGWMNTIINNFKVKNVIKAHPGQVFYYSNFKMTMYGSQDLVIECNINNHNEESLSMMVEFNDKDFLILGDAYPQNTKALATIYKESLKADIVQTSHHGYNNTDADQVYAYAKATMVIWPVGYDEMKNCDLKNEPVNAIFKGIDSSMQFAPHGGNIDFDAKWRASAPYSMFSKIPYCDCSFCKANNRKTRSSNY